MRYWFVLLHSIVETVREAVDGLSGADRIVRAITVALRQIRSDPLGRVDDRFASQWTGMAWLTESRWWPGSRPI